MAVGIIYHTASRFAICLVKPDNDAQLGDPSLFNPQVASIISSPISRVCAGGANGPGAEDRLLSNAVGQQVGIDRYAVVSGNGPASAITGTVINVVKATPDYIPPSGSLIAHPTANVGDTFVNGVYVPPTPVASAPKTGSVQVGA